MANAADTWSAIGTWVAAVGTVFTLGWAVVNEIRLRTDLRDERRIAQARQVFAWFENVSGDVVLGNTSEQPVYEVIVYLVWVHGMKPSTGEEAEGLAQHTSGRHHESEPMRSILPVLPPGDFRVQVAGPREWPEAKFAHLGVELAFSDSANRHWVRRASGQLRRLVAAPANHYAILRPLVYSTLEDRGSIEGV